MRLKNKKTGEIREFASVNRDYDGANDIGLVEIGHERGETIPLYSYTSLAELNEEWEDCEEPEEHWCITMYGGITRIKDDEEPIDDLIEIGNYFNSKEDAYDALAKLKAWKRLNKCEFRFEGYNNRDRANGGDIVIYAHVDIPNNNLLEEAQPAVLEDLDLLFGGKNAERQLLH